MNANIIVFLIGLVVLLGNVGVLSLSLVGIIWPVLLMIYAVVPFIK